MQEWSGSETETVIKGRTGNEASFGNVATIGHEAGTIDRGTSLVV
jgi:hypothetical protein